MNIFDLFLNQFLSDLIRVRINVKHKTRGLIIVVRISFDEDLFGSLSTFQRKLNKSNESKRMTSEE